MNRKLLIELRSALARLYPQPAEARRVARDAGLTSEAIDVSGSPITFWQAVLDASMKEFGSVTPIFDVALGEYPAAPDLGAIADWREDLSALAPLRRAPRALMPHRNDLFYWSLDREAQRAELRKVKGDTAPLRVVTIRGAPWQGHRRLSEMLAAMDQREFRVVYWPPDVLGMANRFRWLATATFRELGIPQWRSVPELGEQGSPFSGAMSEEWEQHFRYARAFSVPSQPTVLIYRVDAAREGDEVVFSTWLERVWLDRSRPDGGEPVTLVFEWIGDEAQRVGDRLELLTRGATHVPWLPLAPLSPVDANDVARWLSRWTAFIERGFVSESDAPSAADLRQAQDAVNATGGRHDRIIERYEQKWTSA